MLGYYKDTTGLREMVLNIFLEIFVVEIINGRGALATVMGSISFLLKTNKFFEMLDKLFGKSASSQTDGLMFLY